VAFAVSESLVLFLFVVVLVAAARLFLKPETSAPDDPCARTRRRR
jgi:hypothetical protein